MNKNDHLKQTVEHIDITQFDARPIISAYGKMAFQALPTGVSLEEKITIIKMLPA